VKIAEGYVTAYNNRDSEAVLSLFAKDATMEDPVGQPPARGEEQIRALYKTGFDMGVSLELDGRVRTAAEYIVFPLCASSPTGKLYIIDQFELDEDGKIARMRAFWSHDNLEGEMDI
jgi:steroid delta-isomerase